MIKLRGRGRAINFDRSEPIVGRVQYKEDDNEFEVYEDFGFTGDLKLRLSAKISTKKVDSVLPTIVSPSNWNFIRCGDIVFINEKGTLELLYRNSSPDNSLFITDQCNSLCLMCSQPPKEKDDLDFHYLRNKKLLRLIKDSPEIIGITGGEPFLLEDRLIELLRDLNQYHPNSTYHLLTNGKIFSLPIWAEKVSDFRDNLILAVPLYSDNYIDHDFIVQSKGAFRQTSLGLHNLAKFNLRVELRVVLQKLTIERLEELANYISYNFPFVESVALMGMELTGLAIINQSKLWIEPSQYNQKLENAVRHLHESNVRVRVFNMPLCILSEYTREFAVKSISDWKQEYIEECNKCTLKTQCGGVFGTSKSLTNEIAAIL